ncbi:hypothetical protein RvY_12304 [Ramazzottius varieornatus]|uniref:Uncharacterized protein n=1 Tax=Ramazzottius varieornatus TaxID=947166 RepID=A0A1D1VPG8_RAMVA|nr:hypothetical protein RvY_12304 [Ramazzottius varieornatus]
MTQRYWFALSSSENLHHLTLALGKPVYEYISLILTSSRYMVSVNADSASQLAYIFVMFGFAQAFAKVYRDIQCAALAKTAGSKKFLETLREEPIVLRMFQNLVRNFNDTFGHLILLNCIRDMIAVVAVMASILQVFRKQGAGENDAEYAQQLDHQMRRAYGDWTILLITFANATLRVATRDAATQGSDHLRSEDIQREEELVKEIIRNESEHLAWLVQG